MTLSARWLMPAIISITACRSATPSSGPLPLPGSSPATPAPIDSRKTTWSISPGNQEHRFLSTTVTALETSTLTGITRETVTAISGFSVSLDRTPAAPVYSARLESLSLQSSRGSSTPLPEVAPLLPLAFSGRVEGHRLTVEPIRTQTGNLDCSNPAFSAISPILRSLILSPLQLSKGMTWTDSTTSTICSGPVPVVLTAIRSYQVMGETSLAGVPAILLEQLTRTRFSGEGVQDQHRLRTQGEGSGKAQIRIDAGTGSVLDITGSHTSLISVFASGREHRFTQALQERIIRSSN